MLRSERSERLEAWAAGTVLAPTLRDGPAGLLRVRWFLTQLSMKAGARLAVSVVARGVTPALKRSEGPHRRLPSHEILRFAQDDKQCGRFRVDRRRTEGC